MKITDDKYCFPLWKQSENYISGDKRIRETSQGFNVLLVAKRKVKELKTNHDEMYYQKMEKFKS